MSSKIDVPAATRALLERYGFDEQTFTALCGRYAASPETFQNALKGDLTPPAPGDLVDFPLAESAAHRNQDRLGREAIGRGEVAVVVLAGGMATRFGGAVKAAVPVLDERSFLDLKLADINRTGLDCDAVIDTFVMTSFSTDNEIQHLLPQLGYSRVHARTFAQFVSIRIDPRGKIFVGRDGRPSLYAPGHGDLTFALRRSGLLGDFLARGGKYLLVSNVDNLAAVCAPAIVGAHIEAGAKATFEVVAKEPGDKGGAPARLDGRAQIVEEFRFPGTFDQDAIPVFNTNTFVLDARAVDCDERTLALDWFAAEKNVNDRTVIQFERLVGQVTAFLPSTFLKVPRGGVYGRFLPVKNPTELHHRRFEIRAVLGARGVI